MHCGKYNLKFPLIFDSVPFHRFFLTESFPDAQFSNGVGRANFVRVELGSQLEVVEEEEDDACDLLQQKLSPNKHCMTHTGQLTNAQVLLLHRFTQARCTFFEHVFPN